MPLPKLCKGKLVMGDKYGDNDIIFRCHLPKGHANDCCETGKIGGKFYRVTWYPDDAKHLKESDDATKP